jgi:hypothetical protein
MTMPIVRMVVRVIMLMVVPVMGMLIVCVVVVLVRHGFYLSRMTLLSPCGRCIVEWVLAVLSPKTGA